MYQKVIVCIRLKGVRNESIITSLMQYVNEALKGYYKKPTAPS